MSLVHHSMFQQSIFTRVTSGENIVLMGELDQAKEAADENLVRKTAEEVLTAEMEQQEQGQATVRDAWNFDHPSQN
ncbi:unnamed protein product [Aphanomyces euteiches]